MNITPINVSGSANSVAFGANLNGITLSRQAKKEIKTLSKEFNKLVGNEIHDKKSLIGKKEAIYDKWLQSFKIELDDSASIYISTDKNKIRSINIFDTDKNKGNQVFSFWLYNGCESAINPVPHIGTSLYKPDTRVMLEKTYQTGETMKKSDSDKIAQFLNKISKKLGI